MLYKTAAEEYAAYMVKHALSAQFVRRALRNRATREAEKFFMHNGRDMANGEAMNMVNALRLKYRRAYDFGVTGRRIHRVKRLPGKVDPPKWWTPGKTTGAMLAGGTALAAGSALHEQAQDRRRQAQYMSGLPYSNIPVY